MNHTCDLPWSDCDACDAQLRAAEGAPVGYGCANHTHCGGTAYFPSQPGDLCATCQGEANDAIKDAYLETLS